MKQYGKAVFSDVLRILLLPFCVFRIKRNRIIFTGLTGGSFYEYSCNLKYLCEYLMNNHPDEYEIIWVVKAPERYRDLEQKGIRFVKHFSVSSFYWLLTSRVVVSSGAYAPWFPFRKKQFVINTWHGGGAYKRIENSKPGANWATRHRAEFCAQNIDLFVSSCHMATKELIRGSFCYEKEVAEIGMPRNDFLVKGECEEAKQAVRSFYKLDADTHILLYAPTYRYSQKDIRLDADRLLKHLERDGSKWVFLRRMHRYQDQKMKFYITGDRITEASDYPDMQQLLAAADIMITDYSSNFWDYSFLKRPCYLYVPDLEEYLRNTGFYVDIHQWPFPMARDQEELERIMEEFDAGKNEKRIQEHHRLMGCTETGESCRLLAERIERECRK
ncbi:MAG: CDP-glycerol glycerophosphotransferase family protein [Eubacteriales bacterium]|nr:CDP-glycerol glycerophosphotransferase family protein [Eubacteriales bacterium]